MLTERAAVKKAYSAWVGMRHRCFSVIAGSFPRYGGRGITVCERWAKSFDNFLSDMGLPAEGMQIDRIDNDGNYEPKNCRWVTPSQNARNRSSNRDIEYLGEVKTIAGWSESTGLSKTVIRERLCAGWPIDDTLTTPARQKAKSGEGDRREIAAGQRKRARQEARAKLVAEVSARRAEGQPFAQIARELGIKDHVARGAVKSMAKDKSNA